MLGKNAAKTEERFRTLIVDTDKEVLTQLRSYLEESNYEVDMVESLKEARAMDPATYSLMVVSLDEDPTEAVALIERFKLLNREMQVLVTGSVLDPESIIMAMNVGATDYLVKPFNKMSFTMRLRSLASRK